jgi:hypothetical protein
LGWVIVRAARDLVDLRLMLRFRCAMGLLHHSVGKMAPHRVRRLAHSLKRDIGSTAANRYANSPMSMTSPRTTLIRGHYAPLPNRSSAAPTALCQNEGTRVSSARFAAVGRLLRSYLIG